MTMSAAPPSMAPSGLWPNQAQPSAAVVAPMTYVQLIVAE